MKSIKSKYCNIFIIFIIFILRQMESNCKNSQYL